MDIQSKKKSEEIKAEIQALYDRYRQFLSDRTYLWESERDALNQLVFRLLAEIAQDWAAAADAVSILDRRNLLQIKDLSEVTARQAEGISKEIKTILIACGFSNLAKEASLTSLSMVAKFFKQTYDAKIQKFMRKYGQQMIEEIQKDSAFPKPVKRDVEIALAGWINSILNMPLIVQDRYVKDFCAKRGLKVDDLTDIVDDLGINPVVLNDLLAIASLNIDLG